MAADEGIEQRLCGELADARRHRDAQRRLGGVHVANSTQRALGEVEDVARGTRQAATAGRQLDDTAATT